MAKRVDRRVARTKRLLRKSLMELINEQPFETLTVQKITERANLGRATFYMHYKDKEELFLTSMQEEFTELVAQIAEEETKIGYQEPVEILFDILSERPHIFRTLFTGGGKTEFHNMTRDFIANQTEIRLATILSDVNIPSDVMAMHFAGTLVNMVSWWLENDQPYSSYEMSVFINTIFFQGVAQFATVDPKYTENLPKFIPESGMFGSAVALQ